MTIFAARVIFGAASTLWLRDEITTMKELDLSVFGNTPFSYAELLPLLSSYRAPKNKAQELEKQGLIVRLKKGYYVLSSKVSGKIFVPELVANHIHAPSYVSNSTALRHYGLIPERVMAINSITCSRTAEFTNKVGNFYYIHVSKEYYPIGITIDSIDGTNFLIATPEKALCDLITTTRNLRLRSMVELRQYLEEDIRLDMDGFHEMNPSIFLECAEVAQKKQTIINLAKLLRK